MLSREVPIAILLKNLFTFIYSIHCEVGSVKTTEKNREIYMYIWMGLEDLEMSTSTFPWEFMSKSIVC